MLAAYAQLADEALTAAVVQQADAQVRRSVGLALHVSTPPAGQAKQASLPCLSYAHLICCAQAAALLEESVATYRRVQEGGQPRVDALVCAGNALRWGWVGGLGAAGGHP